MLQNVTISEYFESILVCLRVTFCKMIIHLIVITLLLIRFIQRLTNLR